MPIRDACASKVQNSCALKLYLEADSSKHTCDLLWPESLFIILDAQIAPGDQDRELGICHSGSPTLYEIEDYLFQILILSADLPLPPPRLLTQEFILGNESGE
jgi:hypothetical protein